MKKTEQLTLKNLSLTAEQREVLIQVLGEVMSACSESCWYAGWLESTELDLPILVERVLQTQQPQIWGHGEIDLQTAITLKGLSLLLGHWVVYDTNPATQGDHFVAYVPKDVGE